MTKVTLPILHLNGSSPQVLCDQMHNAYRALDDAEQLLAAAAPNERDYYLIDGAFKRAVEEHRARLERIHSTKKEFQVILDHLETYV